MTHRSFDGVQDPLKDCPRMLEDLTATITFTYVLNVEHC
jgi:hypothetical protein